MFWAYLQGMETPKPYSNFTLLFSTFWAYLQGMETSFGRGKLFNFGGSFEPTYKEWKRSNKRGNPESKEVLSLPTRNGNYLKPFITPANFLSFWAYLQGMETGVADTPEGFRRFCFEPTYKEWKPRGYEVLPLPNGRFWAYLQGMETLSDDYLFPSL